MRTVVQLGLWQSAELVFLANKDVTPEPSEFSYVEFTDEERQADWVYYGIDCDVSSIDCVANKYPRHPNVYWVCAQVIPEGIGVGLGTAGWPGEESVPARVLGASLSCLFEQLGIESVDLLAMDIEGAEYEVLECHDWRVKPERIAIEKHRYPSMRGDEDGRLSKAILPHGYRLAQSVLFHGQSALDWVTMHVEYRRHV